MTWPGAPKSASSPPTNPPNVRFPATLNEHSTMKDVAEAMRTAFNGLTVHEQAFANLPSQVATQAAAAATTIVQQIESQITSGVTAFNSQTGAILYFPGLGMVNNQIGNASYLTQTADAGRKILMGDSSAMTLTLNPAMATPWFTFIGNDSGANIVSLAVDSGAVINGLTAIHPGGVAIVFYDGSTFWSEGVSGGYTGTIVTAALTALGTQGSMTFLNGQLISQVPAT